MTKSGRIDVDAVLADLKAFQRRTAVWAFKRMFIDEDPTLRFLVADEVGLGKTHVAKGVIAQVVAHLAKEGDVRHDIVYVCSNAAIARQNLRKLVPKGIEPLEDVERLTMLPLAQLDDGSSGEAGINLLAITPGTSLRFGRQTGRFEERCLAFTFLRGLWGADAMPSRARRVFWYGVTANNPEKRLRDWERSRRDQVAPMVKAFEQVLDEADARRHGGGERPLREVFDELVEGLAHRRGMPDDLQDLRRDLIGELRRAMAVVGIAALQPDLVILDEFQRFKDLLQADPADFAATLAHRLFDFVDPKSGRPTRTMLMSATPYRMYTTADEEDGDHYVDFLATCAFLLRDPARVKALEGDFAALRAALTTPGGPQDAEALCGRIAADLRSVMSRTERLAATPDRDGMLAELPSDVSVSAADLEAYVRFGEIAEQVRQPEPAEYWKSAPYLMNFMEGYQLKHAFSAAVAERGLPDGELLNAGPGLLDWEDVDRYAEVDPQNGRLRWLLEDLESRRAFELLWVPPSLRYYDTGSVYESEGATKFTKRLLFSGWAVVPKVVSCLVSHEAERRAMSQRGNAYSADYSRRGGQRLTFRRDPRTEAPRAGAMTAFLLMWPSPTLAELGDPRPRAGGRPSAAQLLRQIEAHASELLEPLTADKGGGSGTVDQRWYWAAPLLIDQQRFPDLTQELLDSANADSWEGSPAADNFVLHLDEARAMVESKGADLGRPPDDLTWVLAELAVGSPAICALRAISATSRLPHDHERVAWDAAWAASGFRSFFNAPEVTGVVTSQNALPAAGEEEASSRYWQDVVRHAIGGNLQALLDEHAHVLCDWLGHLNLDEEGDRTAAADDISEWLASALEVRTSSFRVDVPERAADPAEAVVVNPHRMRTRFAVAFGNQPLEEEGEARVESVSTSFNSPFWPFVLTSTSVGQEGLDFHLWSHSVVHWNLPANPVDLEQREGRVHRYKGHAVRRNVAAVLGPDLFDRGSVSGANPWDALFAEAARTVGEDHRDLIPFWVFPGGPAKIERFVPVLPFSRESAALPRLRKALAIYRLAFGQPRQEELVEFLGADRSDVELVELSARLRIDLSPPDAGEADSQAPVAAT